MKLKNIFKYASIAVASASLLGVNSCNYLDVVPPEQPGLADAMKNHTNALGFLHSCYAQISVRDAMPRDYRSVLNSATDEYTIPEAWYAKDNPPAYAVMRNTQNSGSVASAPGFWSSYYKGIGQTLLFDRELEGEGRRNQVCDSEEEYLQWHTEARFCRAYYHMQLVRIYGPVPLTTTLVGQDTDLSAYPGRTHFDGCVNWIVNELDECAKILPATRPVEETNRATSVICKALKARLLLYAASDLYNGGFPSAYRSWRNTNYRSKDPVTGKEYGDTLISRKFDPTKWQRAAKACAEALEAAQNAGFKLFNPADPQNAPIDAAVTPADIWIPGLDEMTTRLTDMNVTYQGELEGDAESFDPSMFRNAVYTYRYLATTTPNEGNTELIWGNNYVCYGNNSAGGTDMARVPRRVLYTKAGVWKEGWNGVNPTLYTVEHFLNADGTLPGTSQAIPLTELTAASQFYKEAGYTEADEPGRSRITNICMYREPRFYAWIGFDGGDYLTRIKNGDPLVVNLRDPEQQGHGQGERNYSVTGFLSMKHVDPMSSWNENGDWTGGTHSPEILIRMAELYLNLAECQAEMAVRGIAPASDDTFNAGKDMLTEAIKNINVIRKRAYVPALTADKVNFTETLSDGSGTKKWDIVQWVRNERFIEFFDEGQRYFDVRRWVAGPEYFGYGKRRGLNGVAVSTNSGEDFLKPMNINSQYTFHYRQYLYPIHVDQVYKNPQMVQNPGF